MGVKYGRQKEKKGVMQQKWEICRETEQMLMFCNANYAINEPRNEKVTDTTC